MEMEREPHQVSRPHPWDLIPRGVIPEPLPLPIPAREERTFVPPEPSATHTRVMPATYKLPPFVAPPNARDGHRFGNRT